jgi:asparagine synthase (glutamine-hydrolysing)
MCNEDEIIWVVINGEIYNFMSLRNGLISRGHKFKSNSDTEVLVHLYEEHGVDFIIKLRGIFAIALFDKRKNKLVLARGRMGTKPLFYAISCRSIIFCSELKFDYFKPKSIAKIIKDHRLGRRDFSEQIWALLFFQLWYKKWGLPK